MIDDPLIGMALNFLVIVVVAEIFQRFQRRRRRNEARNPTTKRR